ncbi:MAG: hypothetical protein WAW06_06080 [bacterium]
MTRACVLAALLVALLAVSASGLETRAYQIREDFGTEPLYDRYLNYYYYIPCPTYAWFWSFTGWNPGDILGAWFEVGDVSMGSGTAADPTNCHMLESVRVLDFAGYGCYRGGLYEGLWTVTFDAWCADENGCPVGPSLWNSGRTELCVAGWNYIPVDPPISICSCSVEPGPPPSRPRILITARAIGTDCQYPEWGVDNVGTPARLGCNMHDMSCLAALYPRPYSSQYPTVHSGYYGCNTFQYCPPQWFKDAGDSTPDGAQYGFTELAWRIYLTCTGPTDVEPTTWGSVKSMYK